MSNPPRRCLGDAPAIVAAGLARTALWTVVVLALWCLLPAALGWQVTTVASDSMAPRIRTGDVVAAAPIDGDHVTPGQVLLVDDPDHADRLRLHRLDSVDPDGLTLKGDANEHADSSPVSTGDVRGVGVLRVPWVGAPGLWLAGHDWAPLAGLVAVALASAALTRADRSVRRGLPCRHCGRPRWQVGQHDLDADDESGVARTAAAAVTVLALAVTTTLSPSGAAFSGTTDGAARAATSVFPDCFASQRLDAPVLAWDFGEPRGTSVRDVSDHGQVGTMISGPRRNDGPCGDNPSMNFGVTDARVQSAVRRTAPQTFSVEVWFRTERAQGRLIGFSSETSEASPFKDRHLFVDASGKLRFGVQGDKGWRFADVSTTTVTDGAWHHAVGSFTSGSLDLYLDGVLQQHRDDAKALQSYAGSWRVGRESLDGWTGQPASFTFVGDLDTARVYDTALDAAAVREHFAAGR